MSRTMTARKSSNSFLLVLWTWTLPSACSFFQPIRGTRDRDQLTSEYGIKKVIPVVPLGEEFGFGIPRYVHLASELLFETPQHGNKFRHSNRTNDQQIDVAPSLLLATRNGAVDGRPLDLATESCEFGFEKGNDSRRFREQFAKFLEDGGGCLGPVIGTPAILLALQNTTFGQGPEFALKAGWGSPEMRGQFR